MPHVPGLRSPYARVGRLVYFGRMIDKIRLHAAGQLPSEYQANLGEAKSFFFDARCCRFLGIRYDELVARVRAGGADGEILGWAEARGIPRSDDDCEMWSRFMMKVGWRDERAAILQQRIRDAGMESQGLQTGFDYIDFDEGRDPLRARGWELPPARAVVLMGVAGSGKTTIGQRLSAVLGWPFRDADEFHPPSNIAKMTNGTPLTDEDREPWLKGIREYVSQALQLNQSVVVTCSALKDSYRQTLTEGIQNVNIVYLRGSRALLEARLRARREHFMKPEMLDSQLAALEEPAAATAVDIDVSPDEVVEAIRTKLSI
jgi:carbohydrate kinase (thermoresistant glucokinase family)